MNHDFVRSGTANNYIMAETSEGVLCSNCAPTGEFAGVDLYGYNANGEIISDKLIAAKIAEALDPDITENDLAWMGAPCYPSIAAWEDEQKAAEPFNRDKAFFIGSFGAREIVPVHPQKEVEKPSVQDRLKRGSSAKAAAPKASTARKKEDPSL